MLKRVQQMPEALFCTVRVLVNQHHFHWMEIGALYLNGYTKRTLIQNQNFTSNAIVKLTLFFFAKVIMRHELIFVKSTNVTSGRTRALD